MGDGFKHLVARAMFCYVAVMYVIKINSLNDWTLLSHNRQEQWKNILSRNQDFNLHVMNKRSLDRHSKELIDLLQERLNV